MATMIQLLRDQTYQEALQLLNQYQKCAIIRPTGFGKTGLLTRILDNYSNVIYLYPSDIIRTTVIDFYKMTHPGVTEIKNTTFMTYAKLARLTKKDLHLYDKTDLIISDECHTLGAPRTSKKIDMLLKSLPGVHFLGATATPDRMDLVDEISLFFDNHVVSKYTLHDAFQDGILQRPFYCFCSYGQASSSNLIANNKLAIEPLNKNSSQKDLLRSRLIEISDIEQMEQIIRYQCDTNIKQTSQMKFMVFFSSFEHLHDRYDHVVSWFNLAYPSHTIDTMIVSSEKPEYAKNVKKLNHGKIKHNSIELIFCCDMLNLGYHVNDLTGIVMYRGTSSSIIFAQQLGRILSSGHSQNCIVFDVVDNIHRESLYDVLGHKPKKTQTRNARLQQLQAQLDDPTANPLTIDEIAEYKELTQAFNRSPNWWVGANQLQPEDLIATGQLATYRELIAKTVAEPIAMRCRQAWTRWIEDGGDPLDMTAVAILNQKAPFAIPLGPYCRSKQVTIKATLDVMGVK